MVVQESVLGKGWCLPTSFHSRSYAAFLEVPYRVSWGTKGCQHANVGRRSGVPRGHASSVVRCTWSWNVQRWQTCVQTCGHFPDIFQAQQAMQQIMWQPDLLQVARF